MKRFTFKDRPNEHFLVHHRDPLEAIRGLWGDPAYAEHLVYKPGKFFATEERNPKDRIFHEMWSAHTWHAVQVCTRTIFQFNSH